jgi:hypothetical protein
MSRAESIIDVNVTQLGQAMSELLNLKVKSC